MSSFINPIDPQLGSKGQILAARQQFTVLQPLAIKGSEIVDQLGNTAFQFDATVSEDHVYQADVTSHPIEDAADVTDHIQLKPLTLTLTGVVTNTPIDPASIVLQNTGNGQKNRVNDTFSALVELWRNKEVLNVVTGLDVYVNMVIKNIRVPRGAPRQDIRPTIEFQQIQFATATEVTIPPEIIAALNRPSGQTEGDNGQQSKKTASDQEAKKYNGSIAKSGKEGKLPAGLANLIPLPGG